MRPMEAQIASVFTPTPRMLAASAGLSKSLNSELVVIGIPRH